MARFRKSNNCNGMFQNTWIVMAILQTCRIVIVCIQKTQGIKPETIGRLYLSWYINEFHCCWACICGKKLWQSISSQTTGLGLDLGSTKWARGILWQLENVIDSANLWCFQGSMTRDTWQFQILHRCCFMTVFGVIVTNCVCHVSQLFL